jgi:hypothetical protein
MHIETILDDPTTSMLIIVPGKNADIVIGVPHHAPSGVSELPCEQHRDADENAGLLGYYLSRLLDCKCVIACNYILDSNKDKSTDYFKIIHYSKPKLLIEIHGHGGVSANYDIEISSGSKKRNTWSTELADNLRRNIARISGLENYTVSGDYDKIYFKASKSITIVEEAWISFHIELPKSIREFRSRYTLFCETLAESLIALLEEYDKLSKYEKGMQDDSKHCIKM